MTYGVAGDASGNGWWAQINNDVVGYVELPAGKVGELQIPFSWQGAPFLKPGDMSEQEYFETSVGVGGVRGGAQMPRRLKGDLNGDDVWVANYSGNNLMRINSTSKKTTYYPAPEFGMAVYDVGIDHLHRVWVGLQNGDEIGRFDPDTRAWTIYPLPTRGVSARSLVVVESNGRTEVVVPANDAQKVIRMIVRTPQDLKELKSKYYPR